MASITITDDDTNIYANCFDFDPDAEVYIEIRSKAIPPNDSTTGITAGIHRTADANGSCQQHAPKSFMLEDLPRDVTATVTQGNFATAERTFTA